MARIEAVQIRNYKILANVRLDDIGGFSVFLGPNGCGKSTLFDVFAFLADGLRENVTAALSKRGGFHEVRSREMAGPIALTIKYREHPEEPRLTYHMELDEKNGQVIVTKEWLRWKPKASSAPFYFFQFENGKGAVAAGNGVVESLAQEIENPSILAVKGLGQLANYPKIVNLRKFIEGWFLLRFIPGRARQLQKMGHAEHLSSEGENLSNFTQFLYERHPEVFAQLLARIKPQIPGLDKVNVEKTADGRVVLRFKDAPFHEPFAAHFVSEGTIKLFACLALLHDPSPLPLLCFEEPENHLHPRLLQILAEEFRAHAGKTQIFVSTHSPYFVDALRPEELWYLDRIGGFAQIQRAQDSQQVRAFVQENLSLGQLWFEGHLGGETLRCILSFCWKNKALQQRWKNFCPKFSAKRANRSHSFKVFHEALIRLANR